MNYVYEIFHFLFVKWRDSTTVWFAVLSIFSVTICTTLRLRYNLGQKKAGLLFLLIEYLVLLFLSTVFTRRILETPRAEISFLWSYRWGYKIYGWDRILIENAINIILLMPIAIVLLLLLENKHRYLLVILICFSVSSCIELLQYSLRRGTFEFDDFFHNMLGVVLVVLTDAILARRKNRRFP